MKLLYILTTFAFHIYQSYCFFILLAEDYDLIEDRLTQNNMPMPLFIIPRETNFKMLSNRYTCAYENLNLGVDHHLGWNPFQYAVKSLHYSYVKAEHGDLYGIQYKMDATFQLKSFTVAMWYHHASNTYMKIDYHYPTNTSFIMIRGQGIHRLM